MNPIAKVAAAIWNAFIGVVSTVLQFFVDVLQVVLNLAVDALYWIFTAALAVLPNVPSISRANGDLGAWMGNANYFVPLHEALNLLTFLGAVYVAIWAYKLAKFIRGGG